jgi:hypothetical protein
MQHMIVYRLIDEIESGERPNKKDIAWILRTQQKVDIPRVMREYIAKLLLGEDIGGAQKNSRISPDGTYFMEYSSNEKVDTKKRIEKMFGCVKDYNLLRDKGYAKDKAFEMIAKGRLLNIPLDPFNPDKIKQKWNDLDENKVTEYEDKLKKEIGKISNLVYPRRR